MLLISAMFPDHGTLLATKGKSSPDLPSRAWETFGMRTNLDTTPAIPIGLDTRLAPAYCVDRRGLPVVRISTSKSATESLAQTIWRSRSATVDPAIETTPIRKSAAKGDPLFLFPCPGRAPLVRIVGMGTNRAAGAQCSSAAWGLGMRVG